MKILVIFTTVLITQVSASFLDAFQGAVLSVQNSFGKLLSDVATDVRDTVDCTILAVEHVLSLSDDATAQYNAKCGTGNKTDSVDSSQQEGGLPKVEVSFQFSNNGDHLPAEIDAKINESLSNVLSQYNPHGHLQSVENDLLKESEQLADVSKLMKQELNKLSNDAHTDLKNIKQSDSEPSVDTILQEIKLLENKEQNNKNASEATEIHQVIDEVLAKLDVIEVTEATENIKLDEIVGNLERNPNNSFVGLRQQFEEWKDEESRHLDEIKYKIEEHEKSPALHDHIYQSHRLNDTQPVQLKIEIFNNGVQPEIKNPKEELLHTELLHQGSNIKSVNQSTLKGTTKTVQSSHELLSTLITNEPITMAHTKDQDTLTDTAVMSTSFPTKSNTFLSTHDINTVTGNIVTSIFSTDKPTIKTVSEDVSNYAGIIVLNDDNGAIRTTKSKTYYENQESFVTSTPTTVLKMLNKNILNESVSANSVQVMESTIGTNTEETSVVSGDREYLTAAINSFTTSAAQNDNDMNDNITMKTSLAFDENTPLTTTPLTDITQIVRTTAASNGEVPLTTSIPTTSMSESINTEETSVVTGVRESSTVAINSFTTSAKANDNDMNDNITMKTSLAFNASSPLTEITQLVQTTAVSNVEMPLTTSIPTTSMSETINTEETSVVPGNRESSTIAINNFTTFAEPNDNDMNDNITMKTSLAFDESTPLTTTPLTDITQIVQTTAASNVEVPLTTSIPTTSMSEIINSEETSVVFGNRESSTIAIDSFITSAELNDNGMNDNITMKTSLAFDENTSLTTTTLTDITQILRTSAASNVEVPLTTSTPTTSMSEIINSEETSVVFGNRESSTITIDSFTTSAEPNDNDMNDNITMETSLAFDDNTPLTTTPLTGITQPMQTTAASTTEVPLVSSIPSTSTSETIDTDETSEVSGDGESSTIDINIFTTSTETNDNDMNANITMETSLAFDENTPLTTTPLTDITQILQTTAASHVEVPLVTSIPSTSTSETIDTEETSEVLADGESSTTTSTLSDFTRLADTTTGAIESPLSTIVSIPTSDTDDSSVTMLTSSSAAMLESTGASDITKTIARTTVENEESPTMATHLMANDISNDILKTSTLLPNSEMTEIDPMTTTLPITVRALSNENVQAVKMVTNLKQNPYLINPVESNYNGLRERIDSIRKRTGTLAVTRDPFNIISNFLKKNSKISTPHWYNPKIYNNQLLKTDLEKQKTVTEFNSINKPVNTGSPLDMAADAAHLKALREAKEIIENSKRSQQIIDAILKNKNNYGVRSIFNNPGSFNSGK